MVEPWRQGVTTVAHRHETDDLGSHAGLRSHGPVSFAIRRVFFVVPQLDYVGGAEQHASQLAGALVERGIDTTVFTLGPLSDHYRRELREHAVRVVECGDD